MISIQGNKRGEAIQNVWQDQKRKVERLREKLIINLKERESWRKEF